MNTGSACGLGMLRAAITMQVKHLLSYLLFTIGSLAAGVCHSAEYYWSTVNGQLVVRAKPNPGTSAQTGIATQAPDIGARIDTIAGIADVADEAKKTFGYWSEAQRLDSVRKQAEQSLRDSLPAEDGSAGFVQVWSNRQANPLATPVDSDFVGRYQVGRPAIGGSIFEAVEELGLASPRSDGLPAMEAANPDRSRSYPFPSYTLVAERSGGAVSVWMVQPETLLELHRRGHERDGFRTGKQLSEAEQRHRAAVGRAQSDRSPEAQQAVAESERQVQNARSAYESQVRSREERQELDRATRQACSNSAGECAKARDEEIRWYEEASKRRATGRVLQDDPRGTGVPVDVSDTGGAETPRPLPGEMPPRREEAGKAVPSCALCAFANSSKSYIERHKSFARELTAGMKGMHPTEFRKAFRKYQR